MDIYVSDPNIFESIFTTGYHDCSNTRCQRNLIIKSFLATSETIKSFKFWETDQVGVKSTKVFEVLTMTEIEKMGDTYYFIA
jgi:hypothetical protein